MTQQNPGVLTGVKLRYWPTGILAIGETLIYAASSDPLSVKVKGSKLMR